MQPQSEHQKNPEDPRIEAASRPDARTDDLSMDGDDASGSEASASEPPAVFLLDYDRELTYLEHEGKMRGGWRPTGFKK
jgi:hypothetical protein